MDPHELAIAALNKVAQSSNYVRVAGSGNVASSSRSNPLIDATATRVEDAVENNVLDSSASSPKEMSQQIPVGRRRGENNTGEEFDRYQQIVTPALPSNASHNSQDTTDSHDVVSTPPTSEGFSSQSTNQEGPVTGLSQLSHPAASQDRRPSNTASGNLGLPGILTTGQKRTADGQVKTDSLNSPVSPKSLNRSGHSRSTSNISDISSATSNRIGELSSELRTRLSYAMVKVNNGWQSNSIDEVESLASQAGSPPSSTSTLPGRRNVIISPRVAIADIQEQSRSIPSQANSLSRPPTSDFDLYSKAEQPSRTYESFWREHSTGSQSHRPSSYAPVISPPVLKASLAPSADIRPASHSRRSDTPKFAKPPMIPSHNTSDLSRSSHHSINSSTPQTPNRANDFTHGVGQKHMQTPTQRSVQEADAIETLLFMSSPGNSGNMGHNFPPPGNQGSPQQSPLRAEFGVQVRATQSRRIGLERLGSVGSGEAVGEYNSGRSQMHRNVERGRERAQAIDQLLDEMGDSSSDDEELVLNYSSPRRVTAGRV